MTQIDALALQQVIDAHAAALTLYARQWCQTPEDAVQEALINLLRQNPAPANVAAWLYTTVRRRAINLARAEGRRAKHQAIAGRQRDYWFAPNDSSLDEPDYEKLLTRLPQLEREIIVARIWGERSFAEIAALVEQPMSTVHRKYQRGLAELEQMINEFEESRQTDESRSPLSR